MQLQYVKNYNLRKTEEFKDLSKKAVELFNWLMDRYQLSLKNGFKDENGVYVKYTQMEIAWDLNCVDRTIRNAMAELKELGLVKVIRQFKRQANKIYLNIPTSLTPIKNPIAEARRKRNETKNLKKKQQAENKVEVIECNQIVESEVKSQLGFELTKEQKVSLNEIKDLTILSDDDIKNCVTRTINGCNRSTKQESRFNYLLTTLVNEVKDKKNPKKTKVIRTELVPDWLKKDKKTENGTKELIKDVTETERELADNLVKLLNEAYNYIGKPEFNDYERKIKEIKKLIDKQRVNHHTDLR